jgi:hypothetical protein
VGRARRIGPHRPRRSRANAKPPVVVGGCRVEQFAMRDRSLKFTGHGLLFSDSKEVGPVPRLALGRDRDGAVLLLHCDARWNVLGLAAYRNLLAAKKRAERFYPGISKSWLRTGYTKAQARRHLERSGANRKCTICGKPWWEVDKIIEVRKNKLVICVGCILKLHELVSS